MSEVDRLARATAEAMHKGAAWKHLNRRERKVSRTAVRAVLSAIREPSDVQYDALCVTDKIWREQTSEGVWKTYIDALLKG